MVFRWNGTGLTLGVLVPAGVVGFTVAAAAVVVELKIVLLALGSEHGARTSVPFSSQ
jgi:hypothetical protein